jgi:hypothetical protein
MDSAKELDGQYKRIMHEKQRQFDEERIKLRQEERAARLRWLCSTSTAGLLAWLVFGVICCRNEFGQVWFILTPIVGIFT